MAGMTTSNLGRAGLRLGRVPTAGFVVLVLGAAAMLGAIGAAKPEAALALGVLAVVGVAALAWPEAATLLVVFLVYTNAIGVAVAWQGAPQMVGAAAPLLLMLPIAAGLRRGERLRVNRALRLDPGAAAPYRRPPRCSPSTRGSPRASSSASSPRVRSSTCSSTTRCARRRRSRAACG